MGCAQGRPPTSRTRSERDGARSGRWAGWRAWRPRRTDCRVTSPSTPGGMVIATRPLIDCCPVVPAAMEGRQMVQWDKDSCADAGFLKIDLLGLGMLSAVERCVEMIARDARRADRPQPDPLRRSGDLRCDPGRGHDRGLPDREPRPDAVAAAHAPGEPQGHHDSGGDRAPRPDPGRSGQPLHRRRQRLRVDPDIPIPYEHPSLERPCARRSGRSSSRTRCSRSRSPLPASPPARRRDCAER